MGLVVDHIAALGLKIDRHSTVLGDGEDEGAIASDRAGGPCYVPR